MSPSGPWFLKILKVSLGNVPAMTFGFFESEGAPETINKEVRIDASGFVHKSCLNLAKRIIEAYYQVGDADCLENTLEAGPVWHVYAGDESDEIATLRHIRHPGYIRAYVMPPIRSDHLMHLLEYPEEAEVVPVLHQKKNFQEAPRPAGGLSEKSKLVGWGLQLGGHGLDRLHSGRSRRLKLVSDDIQGAFAIAGSVIAFPRWDREGRDPRLGFFFDGTTVAVGSNVNSTLLIGWETILPCSWFPSYKSQKSTNKPLHNQA